MNRAQPSGARGAPLGRRSRNACRLARLARTAGSDLAAHAYQRSLFVQEGFELWNNFWYAGRYSFVTYSVLYYPLAALLGIKLLAVATIATAALAFAVVLGREWGPTARWSSRTFAVVWAGVVLSAAFPFALGIAFALLALWALQAGARTRFGAPRGADAGGEPARVPAARAGRRSASASPVADSLRLSVGPALMLIGAGAAGGRALARLPGRGALSVPARAGGRRDRLLHPRPDRDLARRAGPPAPHPLRRLPRRHHGRVPRALGGRRERLAPALRRHSRSSCSRSRSATGGPGRSPLALSARGRVERGPAGTQLRPAARPTRPPRPRTGSRRSPSCGAPHARLPRGGRGHRRALGSRLPAASRIPLARGWYRQDDFPQNQVLYRPELGPATISPGCAGSGFATSCCRRRRTTTARRRRQSCCGAATRA